MPSFATKQAKPSQGHIAAECRPPHGWTSKDKPAAVLETAALNEAELAEYCRKRGLYLEQIVLWRQGFYLSGLFESLSVRTIGQEQATTTFSANRYFGRASTDQNTRRKGLWRRKEFEGIHDVSLRCDGLREEVPSLRRMRIERMGEASFKKMLAYRHPIR